MGPLGPFSSFWGGGLAAILYSFYSAWLVSLLGLCWGFVFDFL